MTKQTFRRSVAVLATAALTGCGGGGSDPQAPAPTSYWTMNAYQYVTGGSSISRTTVSDRPFTIAVISTATPAGGDVSNGAYSGSALAFSFIGSLPGTYSVARDREALIASSTSTNAILVQSTVGTAVTTGSTQYAATAGQVVVTLDNTGKYRFSSVGTLVAAKTLEVGGGVAGAPPSMTLTIHDAN